jgi:hypothetical protein
MNKGRHLRRIKAAGEMVHNYRLFPQHRLPTNLKDDYENVLNVVTVSEEKGETLETLFQKHGAPGCIIMWVACRAIVGEIRHGVDGYGFHPSIETVTTTGVPETPASWRPGRAHRVDSTPGNGAIFTVKLPRFSFDQYLRCA